MHQLHQLGADQLGNWPTIDQEGELEVHRVVLQHTCSPGTRWLVEAWSASCTSALSTHPIKRFSTVQQDFFGMAHQDPISKRARHEHNIGYRQLQLFLDRNNKKYLTLKPMVDGWLTNHLSIKQSYTGRCRWGAWEVQVGCMGGAGAVHERCRCGA